MFYKLKELSKLVKSLSGAEKRYFTLLSTTFITSGKEPFYLRLFHELTRPDFMLSKLQEEAPSPVYTNGKRRLYKNILKSLRIFHEEKSVDIIIQNYLSEIEILYELNLPEQSLFILHKARQLANTYEKFGLLLQVLEWEKTLSLILNKARTYEAIEKEEKEVLQKLIQIMNMKTIYGVIKNKKKQYGPSNVVIKKELEKETIKRPDMISYEQCASQKAKYFFNLIHILFYRIIFNYKKAYQYSKELLHPDIQLIFPENYLDSILEHTTSCVQIGKFEDALHYLDLANTHVQKKKQNDDGRLATKMFYYTIVHHLVAYTYMGNKEKLDETIKTVEEELNFYGKKMSIETLQVTYANLMIANLGAGNTQKANEIWENLFHKTSKKIRLDIYDDLYLFRLFYLLQNKIYAVIPSATLSAHRYYKQNGKMDLAVELKIVNLLLREEFNLKNPQTRKKILSEIKQFLIHYISGLEGTNNFHDRYSLYAIWAESILQEQPFYETAAAWYKKNLKGQ